jgi:hypothetical protein
VSAFLEITKGFAIPAGTVMLLASASRRRLSALLNTRLIL